MTIYLKEQLKKLRREKGNTQEDLAAHLGITVQYTAFMVNKLKRSVEHEVKNYEENDSGLLLKFLLSETYDPWREDERLLKIIENLRQVAIM